MTNYGTNLVEGFLASIIVRANLGWTIDPCCFLNQSERVWLSFWPGKGSGLIQNKQIARLPPHCRADISPPSFAVSHWLPPRGNPHPQVTF